MPAPQVTLLFRENSDAMALYELARKSESTVRVEIDVTTALIPNDIEQSLFKSLRRHFGKYIIIAADRSPKLVSRVTIIAQSVESEREGGLN